MLKTQRKRSLYVCSKRRNIQSKWEEKEYTPYEVSKEEAKQYKERDQSQWIMKGSYNNDDRCKENDREEFEEEIRKIEK